MAKFQDRNIRQRCDGSWEGRYIAGKDEEGKNIWKFVYGSSKAEVVTKLADKKYALYHGMPVPDDDDVPVEKFSYYCRQWLAGKFDLVKTSTFNRYDTIINTHIVPELGEFKPSDLTTHDIDLFRQKLINEKHLNTNTAKNVLVTLKSVLDFTAKQLPNGLHPIDVNYPRVPKQQIAVLTLDQEYTLIDYLEQDLNPSKLGLLLSLLGGLRVGELCALQWKDVYVEDRYVHVGATMQRVAHTEEGQDKKTYISIDAPKTQSSIRDVPLTKRAANYCRLMDPGNPEAYVLTGKTKYMEPRRIQKIAEQVFRDAGLPDGFHIHSLRHTFATRLIEAGCDAKTVSEIIGHSSTDMTMNYYVHPTDDHKRHNIDQMDEYGL